MTERVDRKLPTLSCPVGLFPVYTRQLLDCHPNINECRPYTTRHSLGLMFFEVAVCSWAQECNMLLVFALLSICESKFNENF